MLSQRFPWPLLFIIFSILVILSFVALNHFTGLLLLPGSHHSVPPAPPPPATSPSVSHDPIHDFQNPAPSLTSSAVWSLSTSYPGASWSFETERDSLNLGLSDEQCDIAFPDLYVELDRARDWHSGRPIRKEDVRIWHGDRKSKHGQVHVMIYNGQLYVVNEKPGTADKSRAKAALASMYRSIASMPDPRHIPNIEFVIDVEDNQRDAPKDRIAWAWCRHRDDNNTFVMPDFDGWSYPDDAVGGYEAFRTKVRSIEKSFKDKISKAVWRGSTGVNRALRTALIKAAGKKPWADVMEVDWATRSGVMEMHEFCNYQYVIQTEGNSWSGRLRYLHNCLSVPVIHELDYVAHYYPLLKSSGPHQNYVPVRRDFSDLQAQMEEQLLHPEHGAQIAEESVATFRDRYLTPAAEACYWRRLFGRWSEVQAFEPSLWEDADSASSDPAESRRNQKVRGVSFERWAFKGDKSFEHGIVIENKPVSKNEGTQ